MPEPIQPKKSVLMPYNQIKEFIPQIPNYWARKLITIQYATGCRIGELVYYHHNPTKKQPTGYTTKGLEYDRIKEFDSHWQLTFPVFKKRSFNLGTRYISKKEKWINKIITPLFKKKTTGQVFPFKYSKARQLVKNQLSKLGTEQKSKIIKTYSSHNLRVTRADHLINVFNYTIIETQKALCMARWDTLQHYLDAKPIDSLQKIKEN